MLREGLTSQTSIASWLIPFLPCLQNMDATSLDPFEDILPGTLKSKDEEPLNLLLFPSVLESERRGSELPPAPTSEMHDPIPSALTMFRKHSKPAKHSESEPLGSPTISVPYLFSTSTACHHHNHFRKSQITTRCSDSETNTTKREKKNSNSKWNLSHDCNEIRFDRINANSTAYPPIQQ